MPSQCSTAMSSTSSVGPSPTLSRHVWSHPKYQHKTSPVHRPAQNLLKCSPHLHSELCYGLKTTKEANKNVHTDKCFHKALKMSVYLRILYRYSLSIPQDSSTVTCSPTSTAMSVNATGIRNRVKAKRSANASRVQGIRFATWLRDCFIFRCISKYATCHKINISSTKIHKNTVKINIIQESTIHAITFLMIVRYILL